MLETHGFPMLAYYSVDTTGGLHEFRWHTTSPDGDPVDFGASTMYLQISPLTGKVRVYFDQAAFDADVALPALTGNGDRILELDSATKEFYAGPAYVRRVWLRSTSGTATVQMVGYGKKA